MNYTLQDESKDISVMLLSVARGLWLAWNWIELSVLTLFLFIISWLPKRFICSFYHKLTRVWCRFFVRALGVKLYLHEKNINPLPKQYILIANHPSALEDFAIPTLFNVYPLAKQGVRDWFLIGRISYAADTIYVKRDNTESRRAAVDQMIAALEQGKNIALFPEGGCKGRRIFEQFQYGAFDMSLKTGIPILPIFLHYEAQDTFEWREPYTLIGMFWRIMWSKNNRVNYYQYDAINPEDFNDKDSYSEFVHNLFLQWQTRYLE